MCNLYKIRNMAGEIAALFNAVNMAGSNAGGDLYPGYPGPVVADGEVRSMVWGFPLAVRSKKTGEPLKPRPVNNARSDKLDSFMWRQSFAERRCLIPMNAWAEAEGARGSKKRTWLSVSNVDLFTVAGLWRDSDEWGCCYSMIMTDASPQAGRVHNRMPVILAPEKRSAWLTGSVVEARSLCVPFTGELAIDRTEQPWAGNRA